jgi:hypothetical protein
MSTLRACAAVAAIVSCVPGFVFAQERNAISVKDGVLMRGSSPYTVRAITVPDAAKPGTTAVDVARMLNRVAEVGGNAICFDLYGISADGKSIAPEGIEAMRRIRAVAEGRYMIGVCRVFGPQAPAKSRARTAAARTVAEALRGDSQYLYVIDGKDGARLARTFKRFGKELAVVSPKYGDMLAATGHEAGSGPKVMFGTIPYSLGEGVHFVLPEGDASYWDLERASIDPVETQPWLPDNSSLSPEERNDGFVALFDGKSLNGWTVLGANKQAWRAHDGILERVAAGSNGLRTRDRFANFVLRFEWNLPEGGNNGVHLRAPRAARASRIGIEFQMLGDYGAPPDKKSTGSIYDVLPPTVNAGKPQGEWNTTEITLDGPRIRYVLNGTTVVDVNGDELDELRPRLRQGFIVLTEHSHAVQYRNMRLKPLP